MATNPKANKGEEKVTNRANDQKSNPKATNEKKAEAKSPKNDTKPAAKR